MENFVTVAVNRKSTVNIICELWQIGVWVDILTNQGYNIGYIGYVDAKKNQVRENTWNIVADKTELIEERWSV